jgi:hypothetical protein
MILLVIIAWILVKATAPWYVWGLLLSHIVLNFLNWVFDYNNTIVEFIKRKL